MKIDATKLKCFFKKCYCDTTINECIVNFDIDTISMISRDSANIVLINVEMKIPKNQTSMGRLGFRNLGTLVKYLDTFIGEIDININGNLFVMQQGDRVIEYILADENAINDDKELQYGTQEFFKMLEYETMSSKIFKDSAENFITLKTYRMSINSQDGKLTITTGDSESDRITEVVSTKMKNFKTKIGEAAIKLIKELPETVKFGSGKDMPIIFESEDDGVKFNCIIAPRVDKDN